VSKETYDRNCVCCALNRYRYAKCAVDGEVQGLGFRAPSPVRLRLTAVDGLALLVYISGLGLEFKVSCPGFRV
jgi:hypothetical protein